ncbi:hypothetical protein BU16DRAFT_563875 [Lophium mytilinum]|uniref:Uncharacterized protein n=1 Tax=Lophium mytilinum TaxID=390894 RepID=A0A6A6QLH8_9PEZI|nr:hypothetical protein BU16DRAFT_563875 [Lophium mytilinum]
MVRHGITKASSSSLSISRRGIIRHTPRKVDHRRRFSRIYAWIDQVAKEACTGQIMDAVSNSTSGSSSSGSETSGESYSDNDSTMATESEEQDDGHALFILDEMDDDDSNPDADLGEVDGLLDQIEHNNADDLGYDTDDSRYDEDDPEANAKYSEDGGFVDVEESEDDFADFEPSVELEEMLEEDVPEEDVWKPTLRTRTRRVNYRENW